MHAENIHALSLAEQGELGEIDFTRITISTSCNSEIKKEEIIKENLSFVRSLHQNQIKSLYASSNAEETVFLISLQFLNDSLSNIFLDFTFSDSDSYIKKFEISGSDGIYEYHSGQHSAFYSNFLISGPYDPCFYSSVLDNIWLDELLQSIKQSSKQNILMK
ncbi:hypothetical protein JZO70_01070 [Enterococcus sp. 669A]|uniref:Uncharacterized protein n=1 Tax=Candidatus Enterococcus moelleringii TaxID=2815325 RepID=A0ABS3L535_9ENTE|nr:hypothetical protein [Enterococcus sp. 669A]MBO1304735.1 hypothetical protein [Enterococcus sp. 669A]